ncbi:MAG: serine--tRNA ligase [Bdellovibrionaceae bacterium]|nr:serine--tRNA ligase [Pseudobdellovibrionaceae bacterium]
MLPREVYKQNLSHRGADPSAVDKILEMNEARKKKVFEADTQKAELNAISKQVAELKKNKQDASDIISKTQEISKAVKALMQEADELDQKLKYELSIIPNQCAKEVPVGKSEEDNQLVKEWGAKPEFAFKPLEHYVLGEKNGTMDFTKAGQVTGARFAFLKGGAAKLERALIQLMLDTHATEHGYEEFVPPFMVNSDSLYGTSNLPKFKEDLFKLEGFDYFLIPTAEVPLTNYHREEILDEAQLPKLFTAYTPCFRSEAGSYGRDTKGLIRQHQFNKVELVKICHPEESEAQHEKLLSEAESILQKLELHYQVVSLCTGDISFGAQKCYDINVWLPGQNAYREISSCSNFGSFQARRAGIRFRSKDPKAKPQFCHTLNGSGLAVGRTLIAIYENYQNEDGSITVPKVLRPYLNGLERI